LELVGLSGKHNMFPLQLSAGEMQRASIARALGVGPKYLLADEPTGNLDPHTSWEILEILQQVNSIGTTVIMATHNASIVNQLKRRTIMIDQGHITSDEAKGRYHMVNGPKRKKDHERD
jgi:cell division transport system ATP-binding protein